MGIVRRAEGLIDLRRFDEAVTMLGQAIAIDPDRAETWCLLSRAQLGMHDNEAALLSARRAFALDPGLEWPYRLASVSLSRLRRHKEATEAARSAIRQAPNSWQGYVQLAYASIPAGDRTEARMAARHACELAPLEPETHLAVGVSEAAKGRRGPARAAFRKALEIDPQNVDAHNRLASLDVRRGVLGLVGPGGLARAATRLAWGVQTDPKRADVRRNLDLVVDVFLIRTSFLLFGIAFLTLNVFATSSSAAARVLPLALLLVPGLFAARFLGRLTPDLRRYFRRSAVHPRTRLIAPTAEALAICLIIAGTVAPRALRSGLGRWAEVFAIIGGLALLYGRKEAAKSSLDADKTASGRDNTEPPWPRRRR